MSFLRFVGILALTFWIGGLATIGGIAASATFTAIERHGPTDGRVLAGVVFGAIFDRFNHAAVVAGGVLLLSLGLRAALGPRPRRFGVRMWAAAVMVAGTMATVLAIQPRIDAIRQTVSGPVADLPDTDQRKISFGQWHAVSTAVMLLTIVAGVGLLWMETDDKH